MFKLTELQFDADALQPFIDSKTMQIHHDKHHAAYVDNLNKALEGNTELQKVTEVWGLLSHLSSVPEEIRTKVRNNGGGHANHSFFWKLLTPNSSKQPTHDVLELIEKNFGSFAEFQNKFKEMSLSRFGSGWVWLVVSGEDTLEITSTPNQDTPWMEGKDAILGLDVWEHAYYLTYQNRRADYVDAWWNVVNWDQVNINLQKALGYLK